MRIGAHISTAHGLDQAAAYAAEVGCECVQVFAKTPQMWRAPYRAEADLESFRRALVGLDIGPVFTHAAYLLNVGSADEALGERSRDALADELVRAAGFGAAGVVLHMGTAYADDATESARRVGEAVARAWECAASQCAAPPVLLENAAGAGRSYGRDLEQICEALAACRERGAATGLCLDTCHGFAAGWDLRGPQGWASVCDRLQECGGLDAVALVHANDCMGGLGEHRDRHEWIGDGLIGAAGFSAMFEEERLASVPVVVEMPGEPPHKDAENVARLRALRDGAAAGGVPARGRA
jgi:deoxyribonuclease-4